MSGVDDADVLICVLPILASEIPFPRESGLSSRARHCTRLLTIGVSRPKSLWHQPAVRTEPSVLIPAGLLNQPQHCDKRADYTLLLLRHNLNFLAVHSVRIGIHRGGGTDMLEILSRDVLLCTYGLMLLAWSKMD